MSNSPQTIPSSCNTHLANLPALVSRLTYSVLIFVITFLLLSQSFSAAQESPQDSPVITLESVLDKYRARGEEKWESKIQKLEQQSVDGVSSTDALLFYGSSSIRRWGSMNVAMAPYPTINRGYGGAKFVDMVLFADRILKPHQYRALILFAGNDVKGEESDSSPEEVALVVREIIRISKDHLPDAPIFIIEVTPTESRFLAWDQTRKVNATLREVALTTDNVWCIATAEHFLDVDGTPNEDYFVEDQLHLNESGYKKWAELIKERLDTFLPADKN